MKTDIQINYPRALSEDGLLRMLVQRRNIIVQHIMEILEETSAANPDSIRLRRQNTLPEEFSLLGGRLPAPCTCTTTSL